MRREARATHNQQPLICNLLVAARNQETIETNGFCATRCDAITADVKAARRDKSCSALGCACAGCVVITWRLQHSSTSIMCWGCQVKVSNKACSVWASSEQDASDKTQPAPVLSRCKCALFASQQPITSTGNKTQRHRKDIERQTKTIEALLTVETRQPCDAISTDPTLPQDNDPTLLITCQNLSQLPVLAPSTYSISPPPLTFRRRPTPRIVGSASCD